MLAIDVSIAIGSFSILKTFIINNGRKINKNIIQYIFRSLRHANNVKTIIVSSQL